MGIKFRWIFLFVSSTLATAFLLFASDARLIDLHVKAGKFDEALQMYDQLLQMQPENGPLYIEAGRVNLLAGHRDDALQQFEKAYALGVRSEPLLSDLFQLYQQNENKNKMIEMIAGLINLRPDNESLHLQLAELYEWNALTDQALQEYEWLSDHDPVNTAYLRKITGIYRQLTQFDKAIPYVEKYLQLRPQDRQARILLADLQLANGKTAEASEIFEEVLREDKDNLAIREKLAAIYAWKHQPQKAISHLEYLASAENYREPARTKYIELARQHNPARALKFLRRKLKSDPENRALRFELADLLLHIGRPHAALFQLQKHLELAPKNNAVREKIAQLLLQVDEPGQAQEYYRAVFDYGDTSRAPINWLLQRYGFQKQYDALLNFHQDLLDRELATSTDRRAYAATLFKTGRLAQAEQAFKTLLQQNPEDDKIRIEMAYTLDADGRFNEANEILWQGLEVYGISKPEFLLTCLHFFSRANASDRSVVCYKRLVEKFPDNAEYNRGLRAELVRNGKINEALAVSKEWAQAHPLTLEEQVEQAMLHWKLGETEAMRAAMPKVGADLNEQRRLVVLLFKAAMFDETIKAALNVIRKMPADSLLLRTIGLAYAWNNRPQMAMKILQKYHREYGGDFESHYHLAEIYRTNNKKPQAHVEFEISLQQLDSRLRQRNGEMVRARIFATQGDLEKAKSVYKSLLQESPGDNSVKLDLIATLISANALDEAATRLANYRRVRPDDAQALQLQSSLYFKQGEPRKSLQTLQKLAKKQSLNSGQLLDMADLHFMLGDWVEAKNKLEAALKTDPENEAAHLRLFRLRRDNFPAFASEFQMAQQSSRFEKQIYSALCTIARTRPFQLFLQLQNIQLFDNNAPDSTNRYNRLNLHTISRLSDRLRLRSNFGVNQARGESDISVTAVVSWLYRGADAINLKYVHNAIWRDLQYAEYLNGRQRGLHVSGSYHLAEKWNLEGSIARYSNNFADTSLSMGTLQLMNLQTGYDFNFIRGFNLNYSLYSYRYAGIDKSLELALFLENETVHNLGMRYSHSSPRTFIDLGGSVGYRMHNADLTYYGDLNLQYMLMRNLRLGSTLRYGSDKELLIDGQTYEFLLNLGFFY